MPFDPMDRLRVGDASAWPRLRPEHLPTEEVWNAWASAMRRQGEPGVPSVTRVYTHFAFCESTCDFCMYFHQVPRDVDAHTRYVDYLVRCLERFGAAAGHVRASAAYVGGGTPSATPNAELTRYLEAFRAAFDIQGEFSFEAHPRSMDLAKLELIHAYGVNRISMGVQSLEPDVLREITRKNAPIEAITELVASARGLGIVVNLDLVLGLPGQTIESFRSDMVRIAEVGPDIVTLYRYHAVPKLSHQAPEDMHYRQAFSPEALSSIESCGYRVGDPVHDGASTVRLLRKDLTPSWRDAGTYALFDEEPSHLVGFGPGAYGHAFGYGWFREVTAMDQLDQPTYWGTRLSPLDECRQILLDALARGKPWDSAALRTSSGVDVETELAEPLGWARGAGALVSTGTEQKFGELSRELRERIVAALMPSVSHDTTGAAPPSFQRELVSLRRARRDEGPGDPELFRWWCSAIGVPDRGRRMFGAIVRDFDDRSVHVAVHASGAPPLRVLVHRPGDGRAYFEGRRFAISYTARPGAPLRDAEKAFLDELVRATRRLEQES